MRLSPVPITLMIATCLAVSTTRGDDVADELAKFQGTWKLISVEADGRPSEDVSQKNITVTFDGASHTVKFDGKVIEKNVKIVIDPTKTPKEVTDTVTEGINQGMVIKGIYKLEGDRLTSCIDYGGDRPTEFAAPAGTKQLVRVFERVAAPEAVDDTPDKKDMERFQGTWAYESMVVDGQELPADNAKDIRLIIDGNRFSLKTPEGTMVGTFQIDATSKPKTIDTTFTDGPRKGMTSPGIYELDETTYKVCVPLSGTTRPTEFASSKGSGLVLQVLKKVKP